MISSTAKSDLDDLRAEGLKPTDDDIIRLHTLGARMESGPHTTAANAPRSALLGDTMIWEPSLAAWEWYSFAKQNLGASFDEYILLAFACALARVSGAFDSLYDLREAKKRLRVFRRSLPVTHEELVRIVLYVSVGFDDVTADKTPIALKRESEKTASERESEAFAAVESLLSQAAVTTGLTFDDIMIQTPSRLSSMIYEYHIKRGHPMKESSAKLQCDYLVTLHNIRERLLSERLDHTGDSAEERANSRRNAVDDNGGNDARSNNGEQNPSNKPSHAV